MSFARMAVKRCQVRCYQLETVEKIARKVQLNTEQRELHRLLQYMRLSALFSSLGIINVSIIGMLFDHNCRHLKYFLFSQFRSGFVIQSVRLLHGVSGSVCYICLLRCAGSPWDCCFQPLTFAVDFFARLGLVFTSFTHLLMIKFDQVAQFGRILIA